MLKHFRQYSLLRTDILQKTVFGCPWKNSVHWLYSVVVIPRELSRREIWNKSKTENARYARYKRRKGFFKSVLEKMTYSSVVMGRDPFNQNFRKFWSKTQWIGSVRSNRKSFEKTGPPFEVVLFSRSDRSEFWLNGSRPWREITHHWHRDCGGGGGVVYEVSL